MADEKLNTGPGEEKFPEAPAPVTADARRAAGVTGLSASRTSGAARISRSSSDTSEPDSREKEL